MGVLRKVELVKFNDLGEGNIQVQVAVNGVLAPMIDDHKQSMERFRNDAQYFDWIGKQSELLIHLYGDARYPLAQEAILEREKEGF